MAVERAAVCAGDCCTTSDRERGGVQMAARPGRRTGQLGHYTASTPVRTLCRKLTGALCRVLCVEAAPERRRGLGRTAALER